MEEQLYAIAEYVPADKVAEEGKPYPISKDELQRGAFEFWGKSGSLELAKFTDSAHLEGRNWTIVQESDLTPEQRRMAGLPTEDATIAELRERIEAVEKQVVEITGIAEEMPSTEWPQAGDKFWVLDVTGEPFWSVWPGGSTVSGARSFLGIYETREQAERRAKQVRIVIEELNSGRSVRIRDGEDALMP